MSAARQHRPLTVTLAVVLLYASGLLNAGVGILVLLERYHVPGDQVLVVSLAGVGIILLGLLTLAVSAAVGRGSRLARGLVSAYLSLQLVLHAFAIAATDWDAASILQAVVGVLILVALWVPPASRHFARPTP